MATIKFRVRSNSSNSPIYLRLSSGRNLSLERKTSLSINPADWSSKTGLPKQNNPQNKNTTFQLKKLEAHVFNSLNKAYAENTEVNGDWIHLAIEQYFGRISANNESELVIDIIQGIINNAHVRDNGKGGVGLGQCRINAYKRLKALFQEYQGNKRIKVSQLSKIAFNDFKIWLLEHKNYSPTYTFKKLSDLKTVCKEALGKGIETSAELATIKTRQISAYDHDMDVITLTPDELKQIENAELAKEAHENARKWLMLACHTGQRGEALTKRINKDSFEKYGKDLIIKIVQKKGNKPVIIPVLPKVKEIYESGLPYPISTQKLNKYFKEIGKIAKLDTMILGRKQDKETRRGIKKLRPKYEYISTHIGRRTFATSHYGKIPTPIIMRVTGHSKESTFLTYINQSDDSHIDTFLEYYKTKELKKRKEPQLNVVKKAR